MKLSEATKDKVRKYSQIIFCVLAWILLLCILIQVALAGLAVFVDGSIWKKHFAFIKFFEYIPAFMYIFGSAGGVPQKYKAWSMMLFLLCNFQYYTVFGWLGAIHVIVPLFIFLVSLYVAWGSYQFLHQQKKEIYNQTLSMN